MNLSGLDMLHGLPTIGEPVQLQPSIKMGRWDLGKLKIDMPTIANKMGTALWLPKPYWHLMVWFVKICGVE